MRREQCSERLMKSMVNRMDCRGRITSISRDFCTGGYIIILCAEDAAEGALREVSAFDDLAITMKKYRRKRSLDANAYYWKLISKLAEKLHISKGRMHNIILRKYGQREYIDGKIVTMPIPDTEGAENTILEAETYHIKPTSQVKEGKDGQMYRTYVMLRGSSSYDSKEMSELIDGLVSDCKEMGIETLPPEEIEQMLKAWHP